MGGKKKQSLRQLQKAQTKKQKSSQKEKTEKSGDRKSVPGITPPKFDDDKVTSQLKKMKVLTPSSVAARFNLRLSVARSFLKDLERKGLITFVSRSRNLKIYKPAD
ncbi:MAG: 40S ribosomal protein S25 [Candidatus Bathyarchaeota archaeon]|jgi:ribosomal protein S25|nr:MAG: 40S ribosomal protein S25 [Candidatus Bathyarchaeota archaeon]